jgi:hypothetical protein
MTRLVSILAPVSSEKFLEYEFAGAKIRAPEAIQRRTKVRKAVFRRVSQHAQGAQDDEAMVASLVTGITVINEECVGGQFQCQGNGGSLAGPRPERRRTTGSAGARTISHSGRFESS